ncbi:kinase-like domain-containing protein [Rhizophagus clarus]|uniref:Kinase-like domain-containing protein n=1 Tax=Rhizophagus clarus TaxID=94130 RepID=A0A8H3MI09_9GLOM|nr:kinase-like domain-containing protein [Rhizophagus clarus]
MVLRYIYGGNLRENLIRHFINQSNNNSRQDITKEIDSVAISSIQKNPSIGKDFNILVDEINNDFICKLINEAPKHKLVKQKFIEYFNNHNINLQEFYNWLLCNQTSTNSIFLFGYFNYYGIVNEDNEKAFNLFINASEKNHTLAQFFVGKCYKFGYGTNKNGKLAFEYYEKAANKNCAVAQLEIGDKEAQYNLALMYENGDGITKDIDKAIYWYDKSANQGNKMARDKLKELQNNNL